MDGVMTKEEKRERRKVRHESQNAIKSVLARKMGLYATNAQIHAAARKVTDQAISRAING